MGLLYSRLYNRSNVLVMLTNSVLELVGSRAGHS